MGHWKEIAMEIQEQEGDQHLADLLGISNDELNELVYEIETDESKDGLIYNYRVEFDTVDSAEHILKKIKNLEDGCRVYLQPWDFDEEYDYEEQYDAITENKEYLQKFKDEIANLEALNSLKIPDEILKGILHRQLFISVIGTMETFLSDAFINLTNDNEEYFKNFIKTHPEFKKRKFELREIFEEYEKIKETAKKVMLDTIYHNLPTISQMFMDTFNIKFPAIKDVYDYVLKRHDLVHRNGKTKEGEIVVTDEKAITELIGKVTIFINDIAAKLNII
jgi:dGTP triphosphohydrolase